MPHLARSLADFLFYLRLRRAILRDWRARHLTIFAKHPEYRRPAPVDVETRHRAKWRPFGRSVRLDTLRLCAAIAGKADPRIIPEEIFAADIERCLSTYDWYPFFSHKSFFHRFFPPAVFPECLLHGIGRDYFDPAGQPLALGDLPPLLKAWTYPVVFKPNTGTGGGKGVRFPATPDELRDLLATGQDFVVQLYLRQHPFLQAFNRHGLNTLRVYTYKSVKTGKAHVLNTALRMGRGGSLDNETAGGIVCFVHPDGRLNDFAVDKHGDKFDRHPDTQVRFGAALVVPDFEAMKQLTLDLAGRLPMMALAGWDMCLDDHGRWRCIEVNLAGHSIRFSQYAGQPFFGDFTDEVIDYCLHHPQRRRAVRKVF